MAGGIPATGEGRVPFSKKLSENERETAFLGQVISYDDTAESRRLKARITEAQQDERCVQRARRLPSLLMVVAAAGLGYWAVFLSHDASKMAWSARQFIANGFWGLGLGSLVSLLVLAGLGAVYRKRTRKRREEGRRFAARLLETRLGKRTPRPLPGAVEEQELFLNLNAAVVPASKGVNPIVGLPQARVAPEGGDAAWPMRVVGENNPVTSGG